MTIYEVYKNHNLNKMAECTIFNMSTKYPTNFCTCTVGEVVEKYGNLHVTDFDVHTGGVDFYIYFD